jgi:glycosyltransferase involved in cell wall biosynthesis
MYALIDLTLNNKGRYRTLQGLLPALEQVRTKFDVSLDYVLPRENPIMVPVSGKVYLIRTMFRGADYLNEAVRIPALARGYDALFTYRESLRLPSRRSWRLVIQIHEHPLTRYAPATSLRRCLLDSYTRWRSAQVYGAADQVLFSSRWTKSEFTRLQEPCADRASVLYLSGWADDVVSVWNPLPPEPYVLVMASRDHRDDLAWGLEAWRKASLPRRWRLLVVGHTPAVDLPDNVDAVGWLPDQELRSRLARATVYLHLGKLEGFGLGVVEALQLGVPVVAPLGSALDEILAGGGGELVRNADEAAGSLRRLAEDSNARSEARQAGARYSWRDTARGMLLALCRGA